MAFGRFIRRVREEREMTLTELARRVEVSIAYLSRIERERENSPPDRLMEALARPRPGDRRHVRGGPASAPGFDGTERGRDRGLSATGGGEGAIALEIVFPMSVPAWHHGR